MTLPKYKIAPDANAADAPDKYKAAINLLFENSHSIRFEGTRPKPETDVAGKKGETTYCFQVETPIGTNGAVFSYIYLSEKDGHIYRLKDYDRRSNAQYEYIPADKVDGIVAWHKQQENPVQQAPVQQPVPEEPAKAPEQQKAPEPVQHIAKAETPLKTHPEPHKKAVTHPKQDEQPKVAAKEEAKPEPKIAAKEKPVEKKPESHDKLPKEVVRQYISPLGKLHDLAKWAATEANEIYPEHAPKGRNNGHKVQYEKLAALVQLESTFNPNDVSSTGCTGLGQFCKKTYDGVVQTYGLKKEHQEINFASRKDPAANMLATAVHLAENLNHPKAKGDETKAYIIHNLGDGSATKFIDNLASNGDKRIDPKTIPGVEHNKGLYCNPEKDKEGHIVHDKKGNTVYGKYKTYNEAYKHIDVMLERKEESAQRDLVRAEEEAKSKLPKKKLADIDIGDDLRNNLASSVKMIEIKGYNHIHNAGISSNQTQIT
jgi:soluble lytic murein transglycosylase-like protein